MKSKQCQLTSKCGQGDTEKSPGGWKFDQAVLEISCTLGCEGWDGVCSQGLAEEGALTFHKKGKCLFMGQRQPLVTFVVVIYLGVPKELCSDLLSTLREMLVLLKKQDSQETPVCFPEHRQIRFILIFLLFFNKHLISHFFSNIYVPICVQVFLTVKLLYRPDPHVQSTTGIL